MRLALILEVEPKPFDDTINIHQFVNDFLESNLVGLTHEVFDEDEEKIGEIDVNQLVKFELQEE